MLCIVLVNVASKRLWTAFMPFMHEIYILGGDTGTRVKKSDSSKPIFHTAGVLNETQKCPPLIKTKSKHTNKFDRQIARTG